MLFYEILGGEPMQSSFTILKYFLGILDFIEFLATPFGLRAAIILFLWSRFIWLG